MTTEYLLQEQVERVLAAITPANRLALRVALHTGLRIGDVLALRRDQIFRGPQRIPQHKLWITESKTGKRRQVGLTDSLLADMGAECGPVYVFSGRDDPEKHRSRQAVWKDMKKAAKAFRLPVNAGPHSLRKVYAVELMRKYGDLEKVRRCLNHEESEVTLLYALADQLLTQRHRKPRRGA